jgi:hypothetical protein
MSAVQARIHYSFKQEIGLLRDIIRDYTPDEYNYEPVEGTRKAKRSDYDLVTVIPVSDPNAATMAQKIVQYQAVLQLASQAPQLYDMATLHRQMLEVLGIKNAEKLITLDEDHKPKDPISENMDAINNKPLKAFIYQDHDAHLTAHQSFMQDPQTAALIGQSPLANQISAAMQAHMAEHYAFKYRQMIEQQMGAPLPKPDEELPEEYELQISRLVAQASQQVLQNNQQQAAQQQIQQQQQDPIIQMQMQELQIKQGELQLKQQKQQIDAAAKADQIRIEEARIEAQKEIAAMQVGAQSAAKRDQLNKQQHTEGVRMGIDAAKHRAQMAVQMAQRAAQKQPSNKPKKERD